MADYKHNSIKAIYGKNTIDNLTNISEKSIEDFYKYTHRINSKGIQIPDQIYTINSYHGFSSYTSYISNSKKENPNPNLVNQYSKISYQQYADRYKLIKGKDIDWDNAYLKYLSVQKGYDQPITYYVVNPDTHELDPNSYICNDYIFDRLLSNNSYTINSTYELLNIIDFLFTRYNSLWFELRNVKNQYENKNVLSSIESINE